MRRRWEWIYIPCITISFLGAAQLSRLLVLSPSRSAPVWPPSAVGLTAALRFGKARAALGVFLGSFLHLVIMYLTTKRYHSLKFVAISPAIAAINGCEAVLCSTMVHAIAGRTESIFDTGHGALAFFAVVPFAPLASGYSIALLQKWLRLVAFDQVGRVGAIYWLGRIGGMYALTPAMTQPIAGFLKRKRYPLISLSMYIVIAAIYSFTFLGGWGLVPSSQVEPAIFPAIGVLLLASIFMDVQKVSAALLITMVMVIVGTAEGMGPFALSGHTPLFSLGLEQSFICIVSASTLSIAALVGEKDARNADVLRLNELLKTRIHYRTSESAAAFDRAEDTTRQKQSFIQRVRDEVRGPIAGIVAMSHDVANGINAENWRARVGSTMELLLTVLDDLVDIGYVEGGRMCSEALKFDPIDLFKRSLALGRPGFIDRATWQVGDPPPYVEGDSKKLQRCLVSTIADCCAKLTNVRALTCAIGTKQSHSQGLKQLVRVWFEIHATDKEVLEPIDPEVGWTPVQLQEEDEMADRPACPLRGARGCVLPCRRWHQSPVRGVLQTGPLTRSRWAPARGSVRQRSTSFSEA